MISHTRRFKSKRRGILLGRADSRGRSSGDCVSGNSDDLSLIGRDFGDGGSHKVGDSDHAGRGGCNRSRSSGSESSADSRHDRGASRARDSDWVLLTDSGEQTDAGLARAAGARAGAETA